LAKFGNRAIYTVEMHDGMLEGMQVVPGWKALLPPPSLVPAYESHVPGSVAVWPSIKQEVGVVSSEAVRRALYSAALEFMTTSGGVHLHRGQPRPVLPQREQRLMQVHPDHRCYQTIQQQRQSLRCGHESLHLQSTVNNLHYRGGYTAPVTSLMTSPVGELPDGIIFFYIILS